MKKNTKTLIAVGSAIVILCGATVFLMKSGDNEVSPTEQPTETATPVNQYNAYKVDRNDVSEFTVSFGSEKFTVTNTGNGQWSIDNTLYDELDQSKLENLLMCVFTMMSNNEIEKNASDLSKYGLEDAAVTIEITKTDNTKDTLLIGDLSPTLSEYFFTVKDSGTVYTIYSYKVDTIMKNAAYYKTYDRFNPAVNDITNIKLERKGMDTLELRTRNINAADGYSVAWEVVQPYEHIFNGIDQFINDKILTPISELSISAPAEEGADCGFENPSAVVTLTITAFEGTDKGKVTTEKIIVGNTVEDVTYIQYNDKAYAVAKKDIQFVYTDAFLAVSKLQALVDIQNTDKVTITNKSEKTVIDISHGSEPSDLTFKVNGADADADASRKIYQEIIAMNVDAVYENQPIGETEISIEFNGYNGGENVKIEFAPVNELNYALTRNGKTYFVIKKTKVSDMLDKLSQYIQNPQSK